MQRDTLPLSLRIAIRRHWEARRLGLGVEPETVWTERFCIESGVDGRSVRPLALCIKPPSSRFVQKLASLALEVLKSERE